MKKGLQYWIRLAEQEVAITRQRLPPAVRAQAEAIPVTCIPRPTRAMRADGTYPDLLGLFVGEAFPRAEVPGGDLPAQILLFVENLARYVEFDAEAFRNEVRTTYLHELGHYLGLDENALLQRDLE